MLIYLSKITHLAEQMVGPPGGPKFRRPILTELARRLGERRRYLQVLFGPRQSGKTTLALQAVAEFGGPSHYASADAPGLPERSWIETHWNVARAKVSDDHAAEGLLVLDEIQRLPEWASTVKALWDEDSRVGTRLKVILLGSAPLTVQRGLGESLAGRFEILRVPHWSFPEMSAAFGWDLDRYLYFGGYPGAAPLASEPDRWRAYILDSLVETTLSRDVLLLTRVDKPILLRQLFLLACEYSGQILSYQKMLGQFQDAGNTTTLAHYLSLLDDSGLVTGLQKFSGRRVRRRGSIPKLIVRNTALMAAVSGLSFEDARSDRGFWGRLVESAVGAHLLNSQAGGERDLYYWRERNQEVDFVLSNGRTTVALEVKSGPGADPGHGLSAFSRAYPRASVNLVGGSGLSIETALSRPRPEWYSRPDAPA